jgi:drug/metabolite transporter (DMT)-like permease
MADLNLSSLGLALATGTSVANVITDVARKKVMERHELVAGTFWVRVFAALVFGAAMGTQVLSGSLPVIHAPGIPEEVSGDQGCALFGLAGVIVSPLTAFLIYLLIDVTLIALAQILLMRALQVSPMSLCIPFMAFSPVFLIPMGYIVLGELPNSSKLMGVGLIVIGSLVMHRKLFAAGWLAPLAAILREKGSRYILLVALILAITSPVEKQLVLMSDPLTVAFGYGLGLCVFFAVLALVRNADCLTVMRKTPGWTILAGILDAATILLLYFTFGFLPAVIAISIKRAGIVLSIFAGWLVFHERNIGDKLIAASGMLAGALFFYLPLDGLQAAVLAAMVLAGMAVALVKTHEPRATHAVTEPAVAKEGS